MKVTTVGIDLAKQVFQINGVDEHGKTTIKKQLEPPRVLRRPGVVSQAGMACSES